MSLMVRIAERIADTVANTTENMLISPAKQALISPGPDSLISPAPAASMLLPLQIIAAIALVAGLGVAVWRYRQVRRIS